MLVLVIFMATPPRRASLIVCAKSSKRLRYCEYVLRVRVRSSQDVSANSVAAQFAQICSPVLIIHVRWLPEETFIRNDFAVTIRNPRRLQLIELNLVEDVQQCLPES